LRDQHADAYAMIRDTVRLVAPFFSDFLFRPQQVAGDELVALEWHQVNSDYPFQPAQFSDGTLRFIALATTLLQPDPPSTIIIDEPELGLHPQALEIVSGLILQATERMQLILSTQSAALVTSFEPEHIVVVERSNGSSTFRRLDEPVLAQWLSQDYTLGELWIKNVLGGGPQHE
jgi:predicted ATPase